MRTTRLWLALPVLHAFVVFSSFAEASSGKKACIRDTIDRILGPQAPVLAGVIRSKSDYLWDNWGLYDSETGLFHRYSLSAPRKLNADDRHFHAALRHFESKDGISWTDRGLVLSGRPGQFDEIVWSGNTIQESDGTFSLYYTGTRNDERKTQVIALAVSKDGHHFERKGPVLDWRAEDIQAHAIRLGYDFTEDDGIIMAWRDPYPIEDRLFFAAKARSGDGTVKPVIGRAERVKNAGGDSWRLLEPLDLNLGPKVRQIEVPNVVRVKDQYYLLISTVDRLPEETGGRGASTQVRVFRSGSMDGPWKPATPREGILIDQPSRIYAMNLMRGAEQDGSLRGVAFYQNPHPDEMSLSPMIRLKIRPDGNVEWNF